MIIAWIEATKNWLSWGAIILLVGSLLLLFVFLIIILMKTRMQGVAILPVAGYARALWSNSRASLNDLGKALWSTIKRDPKAFNHWIDAYSIARNPEWPAKQVYESLVQKEFSSKRNPRKYGGHSKSAAAELEQAFLDVTASIDPSRLWHLADDDKKLAYMLELMIRDTHQRIEWTKLCSDSTRRICKGLLNDTRCSEEFRLDRENYKSHYRGVPLLYKQRTSHLDYGTNIGTIKKLMPEYQSTKVPKYQSPSESQYKTTIVGSHAKKILSCLVSEFLDFNLLFQHRDFSRSDFDKGDFCWTLIWGPAGFGKTRLAIEVLKSADFAWRKCNPGTPLPSHFGIVDIPDQGKRQFDDSAIGESESRQFFFSKEFQDWNPTEPVILVLDYGSHYGDLHGILRQLYNKAKMSEWPIRLIILDRDNKTDNIWQALKGVEQDDLLHHYFYPHSLDDAKGAARGIELKPLSMEDGIQIVRDRISTKDSSATDCSDEYIKELLIRVADSVEDGEPSFIRPLFAAMVGEMLDFGEARDDAGHPDIFELLDTLIARTRNRYWFPTSGKTGKAFDSDRYENLLALSTFCRGLRQTEAEEAAPISALRLPEKLNLIQYIRLAITPPVDSEGYPRLGFLEPDYIGEWFVLYRLGIFEQFSTMPRAKDKPDRLPFLNKGWEYGGERVLQFLRHCHQNFPDQLRDAKYLLPNPGIRTGLVCQLMETIIRDWRWTLNNTPLAAGGSTTDSHREYVKSAEAALGALVGHIQGEELTGVDQERVANAYRHLHFMKAWLITPSMQRERDDEFANVEVRDGVDSNISDSILHSQPKVIRPARIAFSVAASKNSSVVDETEVGSSHLDSEGEEGLQGRPMISKEQAESMGSWRIDRKL